MTDSDSISVVLVDDQELIRLGFRMVLEAEGDIEVLGEAADGEAGIEQVLALQPDVVLLDIRMPRLDGISATKAITEQSHSRVLILTTFDLDEYALGALEAGASGFMLKDAKRTELVEAIRAVARGEGALSPRATRVMIERLRDRGDTVATVIKDSAQSDNTGELDDEVLADLSEREREVFTELARGLSNAEIAQKLFLSESTVKTHVGRVLAKFGARDRVQLVLAAHHLGLIPPEHPDAASATYA